MNKEEIIIGKYAYGITLSKKWYVRNKEWPCEFKEIDELKYLSCGELEVILDTEEECINYIASKKEEDDK